MEGGGDSDEYENVEKEKVGQPLIIDNHEE